MSLRLVWSPALPMSSLMSTMSWELRATVPELPGAGEALRDEPATKAPSLAREGARRRPTSVLASTLPALLLLGLCVAGLSDPPDAPSTGTKSVSRLHVPMQDPTDLPSVPLHR